MKRTRLRKFGKNPKSKLRMKADNLLQDYIRLKYRNEVCWNCGDRPIELGHHFITKRNSNALRYYLQNIIPLCKNCHMLVHSQPHLVEPRICFKMGEEWYKDLMETKRLGIKENIFWYETNIQILKELYDGLGT